MRLSAVNDQLSLDLNSALEIIHEFQIKELELRQIGLDMLPNVDERWIEIAEKAVAAKKLRVTSLNSNLFRISAPSEQDAAKVLELGKRLKAQFIVVGGLQPDISAEPNEPSDEDDDEFDPDAVPLPPEKDLAAYRKFAADAGLAGMQVVVTPELDTYAGTAEECVALVNKIGAKNLGLDWDVAGCFGAEDGSGLDTLPDVLPVIRTLRVRDAVRRGMGADWVSLGKGVIPWEDIFEQLYAGGFRGPVILEPRVTPKIREARSALPMVARWLDVCRLKKHAPTEGFGRRGEE
jgi:sugar phosphate isomerase/epimerase